jgi:hypothetical protein
MEDRRRRQRAAARGATRHHHDRTHVRGGDLLARARRDEILAGREAVDAVDAAVVGRQHGQRQVDEPRFA